MRIYSGFCLLSPDFSDFWVTVARGTHPFPSRTRKLSLSAPMVLRARVRGSVGSCPVYHKARVNSSGLRVSGWTSVGFARFGGFAQSFKFGAQIFLTPGRALCFD